MTSIRAVSRREFLRAGVVAGAGLTLAIHLPGCARPEAGGPVSTPFKPNAWIRVSTDGSVTIVVDRSEMGQGVLTSLPMLVADELDVAWDRIKLEQAPAGAEYYNPAFGIQGTGGSTSVRAAWKPLREAGAKARAMLVAAAAAQWGVPASECHTELGEVVHAASRRRLKYGALAEAAAKLPVPEKVSLKDPKDFRYIGKPMGRLDLADKVTGRAGFGIDANPEGVLVAVVARSPVFGGKPKSFDEAAAKQVPGVRHVVRISSGIAVVADGYWQARKGVEALKPVWDEGKLATLTSAEISQRLRAAAARPGIVARKEGVGASAHGVRSVTAEYEAPFLAHACMEPMNATAQVTADHCTVWAPTQFQCGPAFGGGVKETAAKITGLDPSKVTVHTTLLGGGFGRRFFHDFVVEAVEASKEASVPVKVVWSREDDIQHDFYRPTAYGRLKAELGADGRLVGWVHRVAGPAIMVELGAQPADKLDGSSVEGAADHPYDVPNILVDCVNVSLGVPLGFWRSVGSSQNGFILESFIDECAWAAGKDPFEYRRALLGKAPRHKGVLELAAQKAGWGSPLPQGRARGIAVLKSFDSYVAEVAEVSLNSDKTVRVHRVVAAVDCGTVVNPDTVAAQVESAIVYGLTAALHGEITLEKGRVKQSNFHDYPLLRMNQMPVIEVHIVPSTEAPTGIGEPGTPPIAPAVCNALYALTKQRVRKLPIRL